MKTNATAGAWLKSRTPLQSLLLLAALALSAAGAPRPAVGATDATGATGSTAAAGSAAATGSAGPTGSKGSAGSAAAVGSGGYEVIVNAANPAPSLPVAEVSRLFLHRSLKWPDGSAAEPVDLPEDAPARAAFSRSVHARTIAAVKAYWQRLIFSGKDVPPPEKTPADAVRFVRSTVGAVAYVAPGTPLGAGVRVLKVTP